MSKVYALLLIVICFSVNSLYSIEDTPYSLSVSISDIQKQADKNDPKAQSELGFRYANGLGVAVNTKEAIKWYEKAAAQGYGKAEYNLGLYYDNLRPDKELKSSNKCYKIASEQGMANTQYNYEGCMADERSSDRDYKLAIKWYKKAAKNQIPQAQINLGNMYYNGQGAKQDYLKAYYWWVIANSTDDPTTLAIATANRDMVAKQMSPKQISKMDKKARNWVKKYN